RGGARGRAGRGACRLVARTPGPADGPLGRAAGVRLAGPLARVAGRSGRNARRRAPRDRAAPRRAGRATRRRADREEPRADEGHALRRRARARPRAQLVERGADAARLGGAVRTAAVRLVGRARGTRRGDLHAGARPRGGHCGRCALGSARGLRRVPVGLRRRAPSSRRDRAHPKAHRRGEPAALQRHADRRVRTARRRARTGRRGQRLRGRVARVLDRPGRPRTRADRQAGPRDAGAGRWRAACRPRAGTLTTTCSVAVEPRTARSGTRDPTMASRREFFRGATAVTGAVAAASVAKAAMAALPEPVVRTDPGTMPPLSPSSGRPYRPVVTLNGWTLPWRMNQGVKEFHLVAEPVVREMAPGFKAHLWGYNGQSPGPTIEVVEGDRVRIFVTNRLPEHTTVHWHGQRLPNGMDGVGGLSLPHISAGKTFVYEFDARRPVTFKYLAHADEKEQMAMGMMGF